MWSLPHRVIVWIGLSPPAAQISICTWVTGLSRLPSMKPYSEGDLMTMLIPALFAPGFGLPTIPSPRCWNGVNTVCSWIPLRRQNTRSAPDGRKWMRSGLSFVTRLVTDTPPLASTFFRWLDWRPSGPLSGWECAIGSTPGNPSQLTALPSPRMRM